MSIYAGFGALWPSDLWPLFCPLSCRRVDPSQPHFTGAPEGWLPAAVASGSPGIRQQRETEVKASQHVSSSSPLLPCPPTCLRQCLYLKVHLFHCFSFDWRGPLWFQLPSCGRNPPVFLLSSLIVSSCSKILVSWLLLFPYLALNFLIIWVTSSLYRINSLCLCKYLKWFLLFGQTLVKHRASQCYGSCSSNSISLFSFTNPNPSL